MSCVPKGGTPGIEALKMGSHGTLSTPRKGARIARSICAYEPSVYQTLVLVGLRQEYVTSHACSRSKRAGRARARAARAGTAGRQCDGSHADLQQGVSSCLDRGSEPHGVDMIFEQPAVLRQRLR